MKKGVEAFKLMCDCCGDIFENGEGIVCYVEDIDGSMIEEDAQDDEWLKIGDKHYCPDCYYYDDDDNIITEDGHKYDGDTLEEIL